MKVGGNESATKFFQQNGGTAALNSKDPKTKYQSNAATKYKDELKRRAARDAQEYVLILPLRRPLICIPDMCLVSPTRWSSPMLPMTALLPPPASLTTTSSLPGTSLPSRSLHPPFLALRPRL